MKWSANLGYSDKKYSGALDIGGPGFSPARFQEVRAERGIARLGIGYGIAGNQGVVLNLAQVVSGRNTVKNNQIVGVTVLALCNALVLVWGSQASPLLEDDHYRYLWDGLRTATALDPYRLPPSAFFAAQDLAPRWQDILSGINHPDIPTIYGPVLQWLFALAHGIAPGRVGAIQGLLLVADLAVLGLLVRHGVGMRGLLVYAIHPLILKEAMASAHPDGLVALWLLLALAAWQRRSAEWAGAALGLAVGTKVAALVALPLLLLCLPLVQVAEPRTAMAMRWALRLGSGFAATLSLLYLPFMLAGGSDAAALATLGSQWRFNPLLYRIVEATVPATATRPLAALLVLAGMLAIIWHWRRSTRHAAGSALPPLDAALVLLLLLSPVVNPWYWLWALGLSVRLGRCWVAAAAAAAAVVIAVLSYLNSTVLLEAALWSGHETAAPYRVPGPLALVQATVLLGAFLVTRDLGRSPLARVIP